MERWIAIKTLDVFTEEAGTTWSQEAWKMLKEELSTRPPIDEVVGEIVAEMESLHEDDYRTGQVDIWANRLRSSLGRDVQRKWYCHSCREMMPTKTSNGDLLCAECGHVIASFEGCVRDLPEGALDLLAEVVKAQICSIALRRRIKEFLVKQQPKAPQEKNPEKCNGFGRQPMIPNTLEPSYL